MILAIILLLFGTKKLKNIGGDLGGAIIGFKKAVSDEDKKTESINHHEKQILTSSDVKTKEKDKA
ncbi:MULTISPECIES: twin-arginine translocase TatA/TatE family subunit [unclassified Pseudoalteromonas]|uniref:twin-arginine translocase TatA/TatE family subunit n=1 Tax=unclassified Pseudoalteromonas TaxID=194690 RepID=UPI0005AA6A5D|nr:MULTISPECIES: twin-arginine translocase TatA/TatE family subunit [unclassified Pseudoalteromonas]